MDDDGLEVLIAEDGRDFCLFVVERSGRVSKVGSIGTDSFMLSNLLMYLFCPSMSSLKKEKVKYQDVIRTNVDHCSVMNI